MKISSTITKLLHTKKSIYPIVFCKLFLIVDVNRVEKKREILQCPNYKYFGKPPSLFDPAVFDIQAAQNRLSEALGGPNSVRSGSKKFSMPMVPGAEAMLDGMHLKKGQTISKKPGGENHGYWHETKSSTNDRRREAVCAACGKLAADDVPLKTKFFTLLQLCAKVR
jgi:hypothetical protein